MSDGSPLDDWRFLVGEWKAAAVGDGEFGEEGVVEGKHVFTEALGGKFIMGTHESWEGKRHVHDSIDLMYYDPGSDRMLRKSAFSYGFVNNEVEYYRDDKVIRFEVVIEPHPQSEFFAGTRWRSFIEKVNEDEVRDGLEVARGDGDYKSFGVTVLKRV